MGKREENAKKKKRKNKIFLRIIGFVAKFLMIMTIVLGLSLVFIDRNVDLLLHDSIGYTMLAFAISSIVLINIYPESIDTPKVKAHRFKMDFNTYNEFINYLDNNTNKIKFKKYDLNSYKDFTAYYYIRRGILRNKVEFFIILKKDKVSMSKQEFLEEIDGIRDRIIEDVWRCHKIRVKTSTQVSESYILLVNEETDEFNKLVNINSVGGYRYGVIICGYSFNSKKLYVSNQKDGQYFNYRYIRNKFLKVMNLKMKDRIKG